MEHRGWRFSIFILHLWFSELFLPVQAGWIVFFARRMAL